ncbi:MAG: hypothetical protein J7J91_12080 [Deltaproteobacteria bacterium]|nr:hypothetical protein [Deltaproteobacteria bacterium]
MKKDVTLENIFAEWNWEKYYGWMVEKSGIKVIAYRILNAEGYHAVFN